MAMATSLTLSSLQFLSNLDPLASLHISATTSTKITSVGFPAFSLSIRKRITSCIRDTTRGKFVKHTQIYGISQNYGHTFQDKSKKRRINVSDRTSNLTEAGKTDKSSHERNVEDEDEAEASRFWREEDAGDRSSDSSSPSASSISGASSLSDTLSLAIKEPIYEVIEVKPSGVALKKNISRRQLVKSSGVRLRDIRSVDPSLWVTNCMPSISVRGQAILLNLGSLRAITMADNVLVFDHNSKGGQAFLKALLPRLNPKNNNGAPTMPFELEVVEAALISRTQRLERKLMEIEPRVATLLEMLPNRLTADILEQLRLSKQALVELASRGEALTQMLLELLEDSNAIRRMTVIGRSCIVHKRDGLVECSIPSDKQIVEEEEEEIEMLLDNYLQRCESCHGQAERLLDTAKEMEDSIAVSLSSRRLEVSRLELLLQVGTFCIALGALVAGIFGMNLKSYLEEHVFAFWLTTAGIIFGAIALFVLMHSYLKRRKIL